ncbi:MAG: amino acid ABC transporter ATP-binding protein [Erysipelotrichaceae bacterium]|nr:amino acid ABC transporter ATP-binding protein [Erysipelotrichaceae bacterium]
MLEVKNIKKQFNEAKILKDVSFQVKDGETLCIIGSSGSGKTTLLRCLNGLEIISSGDILLDGQKYVPDSGRKSPFDMAFQQFYLFPQYTALENITLAMDLKGYPKAESRREAMKLLREMGLENKADLYPHQLSGGQQQRVAIARALILKPEILCFDEPTSALDPELTKEVLNVIRQLSKQNRTMIIVTHEIAFARQISDHIIFMDDGKIVEEGTAEEVIGNPQNQRTKDFLNHILS